MFAAKIELHSVSPVNWQNAGHCGPVMSCKVEGPNKQAPPWSLSIHRIIMLIFRTISMLMQTSHSDALRRNRRRIFNSMCNRWCHSIVAHYQCKRIRLQSYFGQIYSPASEISSSKSNALDTIQRIDRRPNLGVLRGQAHQSYSMTCIAGAFRHLLESRPSNDF